MSETSLVVVLLGLISACMVAITTVFTITARDVRRTLRRVNMMLPRCDEAIRDFHHAMGQAHQVLRQATQITRHVDAVVSKVCTAALDVIEPVLHWKGRAHAFFAERFGNGARAGPRRHDRKL